MKRVLFALALSAPLVGGPGCGNGITDCSEPSVRSWDVSLRNDESFVSYQARAREGDRRARDLERTGWTCTGSPAPYAPSIRPYASWTCSKCE